MTETNTEPQSSTEPASGSEAKPQPSKRRAPKKAVNRKAPAAKAKTAGNTEASDAESQTVPSPATKPAAAEPQATAHPATDATEVELRAVLDRQRKAFSAEGEVSYQTRVDRIDRCIGLLVDHSEAIAEALNQDFRGRSRHFSLMGEILTSIGSLKFARKHLKKWMKPERRSAPIPLNLLGARAYVLYQPKGVVGIMTPWNFPVNMIFSPLADVLAAGNRAMIKPSEHAPATAELMKSLFGKYFDDTEIAVCPGDARVGAAFSALPLDHLIFTGGSEIGRKVMQAAAPNLTPVTLELGGKSPVIIGESADLLKAAENIIIGKSMNSGQACVSPDYAFLPEGHVEGFIRNCRHVFSTMYPRISDNPDVTAVINDHHYKRLNNWLDEARSRNIRVESFAPPGEPESPPGNCKMPLHLVIEPEEDTALMQHELFGPLLVIKTYRNLDDVLRYINERPRPLALYYFGKDRDEEQRVLRNTTSGGVTINDVMMQVGCDDLPFGGVGNSGIGHYRGRDGFRNFSHAKAVFRQGAANLSKLFGMLPPYGEKVDNMLKSQIKK